MSSCACGRRRDTAARFCQDCGRPFDHDTEADVLLLGDVEQAAAPTARRRSASGLWLPLGVVVAVAAVVAGLWALFAPEDGDGAPAAITEPAATEPASTEPPTTASSERGSPEPGGAGGGERGGANGGANGGEGAGEVRVEPGAGPIDDEADYDLLVQTDAGRPAVVDLDTGSVRYTSGSPLEPLGVSGPWLIVGGDDEGGRVAYLRLDDLGGEPIALLPDEAFQWIGVAHELGHNARGRIWLEAVTRFEGGGWRPDHYLVDLATNSVVDHPFSGSPATLLDRLGGRHADADGGLATAPTGGIYEVNDDGAEFATAGRLLAADARRALVETCDARLVCERTWYDRSNWQPLDLVVPELGDTVAVLLGGTDWLYLVDVFVEDGARLHNVATGAVVELRPAATGPFERVPAVSPDGRWLAQPTGNPGTIELRHLGTGEVTSIEIEHYSGGALLFIDE